MGEPETEAASQQQSEKNDTEDNNDTKAESSKSPPEKETPSSESPEPSHRRRNSLVSPPETVIEGESDLEEDESPPQKQSNHDDNDDDPWILPDSDIKDPDRRICVVTTAALPWRTGTAVNPILRALYLTRGRPKHYVSLVIPWCPEEKDRKLTLGKDHSFATSDEQEEWIREFCRDRAGCSEEERNLKIVFYKAKYNEAFGSIFPSVDICGLIPNEEADVAILEEPEHLNWLRIPQPYKESEDESQDKPESKQRKGSKKKVATAKEKAELGWRFKFRHVIGIIHTNYKAYAEQYGIGASFITAPALCALNALVVRAYCDKVIMLSGTLPSLTPYKEVTCNVHGVRGEFLERPSDAKDTNNESACDEKYAQVYFIGKLIWAKGFDKVLDLENLYREKHNDYFGFDVYGAGGDEKALKRAFYGRIPQIQRNDSAQASDDEQSPPPQVAEVFTWEKSLRSHLVDSVPFEENEKHEELEKIMAKRRSNQTGDDTNDDSESTGGKHSQSTKENGSQSQGGSLLENLSENVVPISVIGDLSMKAYDTSKATSGAAVAVVKTVANAGLNAAFTQDASTPKRPSNNGKSDKPRKQKLIFDPPKSVHEFRRHPIPARFLGTKDHVLIRDIHEHKIFLNMSITEVLCTTSAEALAMGKFVILPKHPSNTFFAQFPNCLQYASLEECLQKLEWALKNDPKPLDKQTATMLSWDGANERLFESSTITKEEWRQWQENGKIKSDDDAARFHCETGMKGQLIGNFFKR